MSDTHVLTPLEAAEQSSLPLEAVIRIASSQPSVGRVVGDVLRVDPWALSAAVETETLKRAA